MKINLHIAQLHNELQANNGSMPAAWLPYAGIFVTLLTLAKIFTNDATDVIIDEIISAIKLAVTL